MDADFGGKPFGLSHYLAIKSACCVNNPDKIIFHYKHEPSGEWWEKAKPLVTLKNIEPPLDIHGNLLFHPAHKADVVRLQALQEMGGIYLDIDSICVKPLDDFYAMNFAIGRQLIPPVYDGYGTFKKLARSITTRSFKPFEQASVGGLCNAVLLSERNSPFLDLWLDSYKTFRSKGHDSYWDEHSVKMPLELSKKNPGLLTELSPYCFHFPLWDDDGLSLLFEKKVTFENAYVHHLWESKSWDRYLSKLTVDSVLHEDCTYNCIARKFL